MNEEMDAKEYRSEKRKDRMDAEAGQRIRNYPASDAYRDGHDRIFGKKNRI